MKTIETLFLLVLPGSYVLSSRYLFSNSTLREFVVEKEIVVSSAYIVVRQCFRASSRLCISFLSKRMVSRQ